MLKELFEAVKDDARKETPTISVDGRIYSTRLLTPVTEPGFPKIEVSTLSGLVDYINTNPDKLPMEALIINVASVRTVYLMSNVYGAFKQRDTVVKASCEDLLEQAYSSIYMGVEDFIIYVQKNFVSDSDSAYFKTDKAKILSYVGNIKDGILETYTDDGVSQEVVVKNGVASLKKEILPNPVTLKPYRTFSEIEQPTMSYIFRAKTGPFFALHETACHEWQVKTMQAIKRFLADRIPAEIKILA